MFYKFRLEIAEDSLPKIRDKFEKFIELTTNRTREKRSKFVAEVA